MAYRVEHEVTEFEKPRQPQKRLPILKLLKGTVEGTIKPEDAYKKLSRMPSSKAILSAGQLALEEAVYAQSIDHSVDWLSKSAESFDRVLHITASEGKAITNSDGAQAAIRKAQLPNYTAYIATRELPSNLVAQKAYLETVNIADKIMKGIRIVAPDQERRDTKQSLVGFLGEADVLALGQRYALREHDDRTWFPLLANHSDDHHGWSRNLAHEGWDISVYTHLGQAPEISYRVQVKSSSHALAKDNLDYGQAGIDVVCINPDLSFKNERYALTNIATEMIREQEGDKVSTQHLDARTEKLLDILG